MGSNRVILTLEQHVDVLDELVRDNRVEVNFTLATNGMVLQMIGIHSTLQSTRSFTGSDTWHCTKQAASANTVQHARLLQPPAEC